MIRYCVYEVGGDWSVENGTLISKHKNLDLAVKRMKKEARKRFKNVYYFRSNIVNDKLTIVDYGSYTKFLAIMEVNSENN